MDVSPSISPSDQGGPKGSGRSLPGNSVEWTCFPPVRSLLGAYASGGYNCRYCIRALGQLDSELIEEEVMDVLDINNVVALKSLCKRLKWQGSVAVAEPVARGAGR